MSWKTTTIQSPSQQAVAHAKPARRPFLNRVAFAVAMSAAALVLVSAVGPNTAAACRGAGSTVSQAGGIKYTTWSDGAWLKQYPNGSAEWSYPSGSDPVPGASPGHNPRH